MGSFDNWAHRKIKSAKYAAKKKAERADASQAKLEAGFMTPAEHWRSNLSAAQKWAIDNPDAAKYDNDGNPVDRSHWNLP